MNHLEITIHVPQKRLAEFYRSHAAFLEANGEPADPIAPRSAGRATPGRASSYSPLGEHLEKQRENTVILEFSKIESILGRSLPTSAYKHLAWWANSQSHRQAAQWLQRGWNASNLDLENETVTLNRAVQPHAARPRPDARARSARGPVAHRR